MKRWKKVLSVLLAVVLSLSCMAPAFASGGGEAVAAQVKSAAAALAEKAADIGASEPYKAAKEALAALLADETKISAKEPTEEAALAAYNKKVELYNTAVAAYKALTQAEKDAMDYDLAMGLLREVTGREAFLEKGSASGPNRLAISKKITDYVGPQATLEAVLELTEPLYAGDPKISATTKFTKEAEQKALEDYLAAYKAAPELVRIYADSIYSSYGFYYLYTAGGDSAAKKGIRAGELAQMLANYYEAKDPSTITRPQKPNKKDYEGGVSNPEYLAAMKAYIEADVAIKNHLFEHFLTSIQEAASYAPELGAGSAPQMIRQMVEACELFNESRDYSAAEAALAAYEKLNAEERYAVEKIFGSLSMYYYYVAKDPSNGYKAAYSKISDLKSLCEEYVSFADLLAFEAYITDVKYDEVNNAAIYEAAERYNALPQSLKAQISDEILAKYNTIQNMYEPIGPLVPSRDMFEDEIAAYQPTYVWELKAPGMRPLLSANIAATDALLSALLKTALAYNENGSLKNAAKYSIFTNKTIGSLLQLFGLIGPLLKDLPVSASKNMLPAGFVELLQEEKFDGAREKIASLIETDNTYEGYGTLAFENGDWGFQDGDKDGFRDAAVAVFRTLGSTLGMVFTMQNKTNAKGDYIYGAYELIIPIFESLGLKGVLSSEEFTARYNEAVAKDIEAGIPFNKRMGAYDATFHTLLKPIINLIDDLMKHPLNTLLDLLPRAARAINSGALDDQVHALLDAIDSMVSGFLTIPEFSLDAGGVNAMLAGQTIRFDIGEFATATITLKAIDWAKLAGCGSLKTVISASAANAYRLDIQNGRPEAYITVSKYLLKAVFSTKIEGKSQTVDLLALA